MVGPGTDVAARLAAGSYAITVNDRSARDNLHLRGSGVNRRTGIAFRGSVTSDVTHETGMYRVWSDGHPSKLVRTVKVS